MSKPTKSLATEVDKALLAGASIAWIARHFHLSQSELEDLGLVDAEPKMGNDVTGY